MRHVLHSETAADVGDRHPNRLRRQAKAGGQRVAMQPDALRAKAEMQPLPVPFGETGARFHRVHDDPVVPHGHPDPVRCRVERFRRRRPVAQRPGIGQVVGRLRVQRLAARREVEVHGQVFDVEDDRLRRVLRLRQGFRQHAGHGFTDEPHPVAGKDKPFRRRRAAAVGLLHGHVAHRRIDARRLQIRQRHDGRDARHRARVVGVDRRQTPVRDGGPHEDGEQRAVGRDVFGVAPRSGGR